MVILLFLFNCADGHVNEASVLLPLAVAHVSSSLHIANSSQLMQRITADPKVFVSELASADPTVILTVIAMLEQLIAEGNTAKDGFERNVDDAETDKDAKTISHDNLVAIVTELTSLINKSQEDKIVAVRNADEAGEAKQAAIDHLTAMMAVRNENLPILASEKASLEDIIEILQGIAGIDSSQAEWETFLGNCVASDGTFLQGTNYGAFPDFASCKQLCIEKPSCSGFQLFKGSSCNLSENTIKATKGNPDTADHMCYIKP